MTQTVLPITLPNRLTRLLAQAARLPMPSRMAQGPCGVPQNRAAMLRKNS
jgi:hypothetical protein